MSIPREVIFFLSISPFSFSKSDPDGLAIRFLWFLAFLILSFTISSCLTFVIFIIFIDYRAPLPLAYILLMIFISFFIGGFSYYLLQHIRKKRRANFGEFMFLHALRFSFLATFLVTLFFLIESSKFPLVALGIGAFCFVCWMWCNRALGYTLLGGHVDDSDRSYFFLSIYPFSYSKSDPDDLAIRFLWSLAFLILSFTISCLTFSIFLLIDDHTPLAYGLPMIFISFFIGGFSYYRLQHIRKKRRANNLSMLPFLPIIVLLILVFSLLALVFFSVAAMSNFG